MATLYTARACRGWLAVLFFATTPALGQSPDVLERWGNDMQRQPGRERPQLLATTLRYVRALGPDAQRQLLGNQGGIMGFYHTWLAAHPAQRPAFQAALGQVPGPPAWRQFLLALAAVPRPDDALRRGPSPTHNDYLWGSYFASGQPRYLDSLVAQCHYAVRPSSSAAQHERYLATGMSAGWSLQANAQRDATVAAYLRQPRVARQLQALQAQWAATQRPTEPQPTDSLPRR